MHKWSDYSVTSENIAIYEEIFENCNIIDCHAHIGRDMDKKAMTSDRLVKILKTTKIDKAIIFPFNDANDNKTFSRPNDEILLASKVYKDTLVPFFRLNPNYGWKQEFKLRIEQGFKGLKLHPRSQNFNLISKKAFEMYGACVDADIPIIVHTGLGLENISDVTLEIIKKFPKIKIILGHAGFVDMGNCIKKLKDKENVMYDTSTLRLFDMYDLVKDVDYRKICFGSDVPYYDIDWSLQALVDTAIMLNKSANQIRRMLGENITKWVH